MIARERGRVSVGGRMQNEQEERGTNRKWEPECYMNVMEVCKFLKSRVKVHERQKRLTAWASRFNGQRLPLSAPDCRSV